jgi:hypothetical protein
MIPFQWVLISSGPIACKYSRYLFVLVLIMIDILARKHISVVIISFRRVGDANNMENLKWNLLAQFLI